MSAHQQKIPRLRDDLRITPQEGGESYVIEDPLRNVFYRIGRREYLFLCRLAASASGQSTRNGRDCKPPDEAFSPDEENLMVQWLAAKQLLRDQSPEMLRSIAGAEASAKQRGWLSRLNLLTLRMPLGNPDPLIRRILPWAGWISGPVFFLLWSLLGLSALAVLLSNWDHFLSQSTGFLSLPNMAVLALIWIVLKLLHEFSHALSCNRYGGRVYEMGILFVLFLPLTYVNASSSWSFPSRWQRIHVALAGMYMELFIAWLAILYWAAHPDSAAGLIAHNTVLVAGVSSLLFNANPLMRFDGYYVLSDLTGIPNLYFHGVRAVRGLLRRWWLGRDRSQLTEKPSFFVMFYGFSVYLWRILVLATLVVLASGMFGGWGIFLALGALISWLYKPLHLFLTWLPVLRREQPVRYTRLMWRLSLSLLLVGGVFWGAKWPQRLAVPGVVLFDQAASLRAGSAGLVQEVRVREGEEVNAGQVLVIVHNDELQSLGRQLRLEEEILELQRRQASSRNKTAELQVLDERRIELAARIHRFQADLETQVLHAPATGTVVGRNLQNLPGLWVTKGQELLRVIDPDDKLLVASVDEKDIAALRDLEGGQVLVDMGASGQGVFPGRIERISPGASAELAHFSLAAPFGGPFDVQETRDQDGAVRYQSFSQKFSVRITVPDEQRTLLREGQQAVVRLRGVARTPAAMLWSGVSRWLSNKQSGGSGERRG